MASVFGCAESEELREYFVGEQAAAVGEAESARALATFELQEGILCEPVGDLHPGLDRIAAEFAAEGGDFNAGVQAKAEDPSFLQLLSWA